MRNSCVALHSTQKLSWFDIHPECAASQMCGPDWTQYRAWLSPPEGNKHISRARKSMRSNALNRFINSTWREKCVCAVCCRTFVAQRKHLLDYVIALYTHQHTEHNETSLALFSCRHLLSDGIYRPDRLLCAWVCSPQNRVNHHIHKATGFWMRCVRDARLTSSMSCTRQRLIYNNKWYALTWTLTAASKLSQRESAGSAANLTNTYGMRCDGV